MTMLTVGHVECDRCGWDCDNGSVLICAIVSDIDEETGLVRNLHFCRDVADAEGKVTHKGCARKLLSPSMLKAHIDRTAYKEKPTT